MRPATIQSDGLPLAECNAPKRLALLCVAGSQNHNTARCQPASIASFNNSTYKHRRDVTSKEAGVGLEPLLLASCRPLAPLGPLTCSPRTSSTTCSLLPVTHKYKGLHSLGSRWNGRSGRHDHGKPGNIPTPFPCLIIPLPSFRHASTHSPPTTSAALFPLRRLGPAAARQPGPRPIDGGPEAEALCVV